MQNNSVVYFENADIYQGDKLVLGDIQFKLAPAETCYIIGKSGSGKTSLLKTIYGSLPLRSGIGIIAEHDLTTLKENDIPKLRRKLGMVFQDFILFDQWTVGRNLLYILNMFFV